MRRGEIEYPSIIVGVGRDCVEGDIGSMFDLEIPPLVIFGLELEVEASSKWKLFESAVQDLPLLLVHSLQVPG